jgi:hypothetical protein
MPCYLRPCFLLQKCSGTVLSTGDTVDKADGVADAGCWQFNGGSESAAFGEPRATAHCAAPSHLPCGTVHIWCEAGADICGLPGSSAELFSTAAAAGAKAGARGGCKPDPGQLTYKSPDLVGDACHMHQGCCMGQVVCCSTPMSATHGLVATLQH